MTADFRQVPVIDVHRKNFQEVWPSLLLAIKSASFVGIDTELSGLGERKKLLAKSIDERYQSLCNVACSRSIISLGLSIFKHIPDEADTTPHHNTSYLVQTFNLLLLCSEPYMVEPLSLQFLVQHGFDFNTQYAHGLPYRRGNDKYNSDDQSVRRLFSELMVARVPVVFHNAFVDLVFLYASLHCVLPATLATFLADLSSAFSAGIYDTKYLSEFKARLSSSYLEYVFRRSQQANHDNAMTSKSHVTLKFLNYDHVLNPAVIYLHCGLVDKTPRSGCEAKTACLYYAAHGWCSAGEKCDKSHDIDVIIDSEDRNLGRRRRQRRYKRKTPGSLDTNVACVDADDTSCTDDISHVSNNLCSGVAPTSNTQIDDISHNSETTHIVDVLCSGDTSHNSVTTCTVDVCSGDTSHPTGTVPSQTTVAKRSHGHRAGYDAFMTAFTFACYATNYGQSNIDDAQTSIGGKCLDEVVNKVYLSGKDIPLQITKSNFARTSKEHDEKMQCLFS